MAVTNKHILIVDDDREYAKTLADALSEIAEISLAFSEVEFRKEFKPYSFDLVILDLRLKEGREGMELLTYIREEDPTAAVIVISGYSDIATAVEALTKGAQTYLEKEKTSLEEIRLKVEHTMTEWVAERRIRQLEASVPAMELVGRDEKIQKIRDLVRLVAKDGEATVLIRGETGTGKELVARAIHQWGARKSGPFISTALTDMNRETISSELFGHERGAFTGAQSRHLGVFEQAHRGILFFDEIGDLPADLQVRLLRTLETRRFRRMGGDRDISVDVQVVTATNQPLEEQVKGGQFREDLYYRIKVFEIQLPPLRERRGDIIELASFFLTQLRKTGRTAVTRYAGNVEEILTNHRWPGNVRELKGCVESAALLAKLDGSQEITEKHLILPLRNEESPSLADQGNVFTVLAEQELHLVDTALKRTRGRKSDAWQLLGYNDRYSMLRRVKKIIKTYPEVADRYPDVAKLYQK